jgi:drug/metabolite transporter (DMT)-like permease
MSASARSLLQVHLAVLLFGLPGLFGKILALSPLVIVFGRVALAFLALGMASAWWRIPLRPRSRGGLPAFVGLGMLLAVHSTTFFQAVQVSSVAVALIAFSTFPVFVAVLEPLFSGERLRGTDAVLAAVALSGVSILVPTFHAGDRTTQGVLWGVISGLSFALLSLLNRRYVRQHSGILLALYQDGFAALALIPFVLPRWPSLTAGDLGLLLILGVLCTAVAHAMFIAALRGVRAQTASMIACLEPVYGSIFAMMLFQEIPSPRTLCGGLVILAVAFTATLQAGRGSTESASKPIERRATVLQQGQLC